MNKKINFTIIITFCILQIIYCQSAGTSKTICFGETTQLGDPSNPVLCTNPAFQYAWTSSPNDPSISCTNCPAPLVTPEETTTYTLNGGNSVTITVSKPTSITYTEDPARKFGFDDWTNFGNILNNPGLNIPAPAQASINTKVPIVSVAQGTTEKVKVQIQPANSHDCIFHKSGETVELEVIPIPAPSTNYNLELQGMNNAGNNSPITEALISVEAKMLNESGIVADENTNGSIVEGEPTPSRIEVWVLKPLIVSVMVRAVNQDGLIVNWTSTPPNVSAQGTMLNNIYKQAAITWNYISLPACSLNFDQLPWFSFSVVIPYGAEQNSVIMGCQDASDYNIFAINNINGAGGYMNFGARHGFIDVSGAQNPIRVTSHELGHGLNLEHSVGCGAGTNDTYVDNDNVMSYCLSIIRWSRFKSISMEDSST